MFVLCFVLFMAFAMQAISHSALGLLNYAITIFKNSQEERGDGKKKRHHKAV